VLVLAVVAFGGIVGERSERETERIDKRFFEVSFSLEPETLSNAST